MGVHRVAVEHPHESPDQRTLMAWLPSPEWPASERQELVDCLRPLAVPFGLMLADPQWQELVDEDWSLSWKQHWQADPVGQRLLILPAWLEVPAEHAGRLVLRMDPGSAFGTGSHPTTRLCLQALEQQPPVDCRVVDLGCGSGVLGLASLALGADQVFAADTDALAVRATEENAALNGYACSRLAVIPGSVEDLSSRLDGDRADLLLCNILAPVIEALAPGFESLLAERGRALLSGLLMNQAPRLTMVLEDLGWTVQALVNHGQWGLMEIARS